MSTIAFVKGWAARMLSDTWRRLSDTVPLLEADLEWYKLKAGADLENTPWLKIACSEYKDFKTAVSSWDMQRGWKLYKKIKRTLVYGMEQFPAIEGEQQHVALAKSVLQEASEKMEQNSWRLKAIGNLIGQPDPDAAGKWIFSETNGSRVDNIIKATEILDEYQDNFYEKLMTLKGRIRLLSFLAIIALICWIIMAPAVGEFPYRKELSRQELEQARQALLREMNDSFTLERKPAPGGAAVPQPAVPPLEEKPDSAPDQDTSAPSGGLLHVPGVQGFAAGQVGAAPPAKAGKDTPPSGTRDTPATKPESKTGNNSIRAVDQGTTCCGPGKCHHARVEINKDPRRLALLVILLGVIGAIVSGFIRLIQDGAVGNVPYELFGSTILTARIVLASVAALAVYIFLGTGVLLLFQATISFELLLAFSFAAGFSEQLVQKGVESLSKQEIYTGKKDKD